MIITTVGCTNKELTEQLNQENSQINLDIAKIETNNNQLELELEDFETKKADLETLKKDFTDLNHSISNASMDTFDITFEEYFAQLNYICEVLETAEYLSPLKYEYDNGTTDYVFDVTNNGDSLCNGYRIIVNTHTASNKIATIAVLMFEDESTRGDRDAYNLYYHQITMAHACAYLLASESPFDFSENALELAPTLIYDPLLLILLMDDVNATCKHFYEKDYESRVFFPLGG